VCVCASMYVREREGERESETKRDGWQLLEMPSTRIQLCWFLLLLMCVWVCVYVCVCVRACVCMPKLPRTPVRAGLCARKEYIYTCMYQSVH